VKWVVKAPKEKMEHQELLAQLELQVHKDCLGQQVSREKWETMEWLAHQDPLVNQVNLDL
jgi:Fe-S cluster biosynthesis and repair protein YggX